VILQRLILDNEPLTVSNTDGSRLESLFLCKERLRFEGLAVIGESDLYIMDIFLFYAGRGQHVYGVIVA
jgi:hypothetical protein